MKTIMPVPGIFFPAHTLKTIVTTVLFLLFRYVITAQILWQAPAGQAWLAVGNWTGSVIPAPTEIAQFGTAPTGGVTGVGINMNNPTNNGPGNQAVGAIEITQNRVANLKIGNSSTSMPGTLTLNGTVVNAVANVILRNNAGSLLLLDTVQALGNTTMFVQLNNTTDNKICIDNTGGITINAALQGAGRNLTLQGAGAGVLQLNAACSYTGLTTVWSNTLQLHHNGGGTLPAGNDVVVNGGVLQISTHQTLHNLTLAAGAVLTVDAGVVLTIEGTLFYNGGTIAAAGTIAYGTGGTLCYGAAMPQVTTDTEFPAAAGPADLIVNNFNGVTLHANRMITGALVFNSGNFILEANDLTVSAATGYTATRHVITNSTGKLVMRNIGTLPVVFPIGVNSTAMNPVIISNGNNTSFGARVASGLYPVIYNALNAVNRTWVLQAAATPGIPVQVNFLYAAGDGNAGFNYTSTVEHGVYTSGWNINQTGLLQTGSYQVATTVHSFGAGIELPMIVGNLGAILPVHQAVELLLQQQNKQTRLSWTMDMPFSIIQTTVQRSTNGIHFVAIGHPANGNLFFEDTAMLPGTNYYRIAIAGTNGNTVYSNIVSIIHKPAAAVLRMYNFVVQDIVHMDVVAKQKMQLVITVTDMAGRRALQKNCGVIAGVNAVTMNCAALAAGLYRLTIDAADGSIAPVYFMKQ